MSSKKLKRWGAIGLRRAYSAYCAFWFCGIFVLLFPLFWLSAQRLAWHRYGGTLIRLWATLFFPISGLPLRIREEAPRRAQPCIYCPNHTSYLDIPVTASRMPGYFVYMGKASLGRIPLFGWFFRNLHIPVERSQRTSAYRSLQKAAGVIDRGGSLVIFPEGGIPDPPHPQLGKFKDGAFRLAIEKQVPIVPVTIYDNWRVLPDDGRFLIRWQPHLRLCYHAPIATEGLTLADLPQLRQQTYEVLAHALHEAFPQQVPTPALL